MYVSYNNLYHYTIMVSIFIKIEMTKRYLFLDFDGVLHAERKGRPDLRFKNNLYPIVKKYDLSVVISSAWRTSYDLAGLQKLLGKRLGSMVIGKTPDHSLLEDLRPMQEQIDDEFPWFYGMRQREIEEWMGKNASANDSWIALDDIKIHFSKDCENLFLTHSDIGLDEKTAQSFNKFCSQYFKIQLTKGRLSMLKQF